MPATARVATENAYLSRSSPQLEFGRHEQQRQGLRSILGARNRGFRRFRAQRSQALLEDSEGILDGP
jgi:hypothetical protein